MNFSLYLLPILIIGGYFVYFYKFGGLKRFQQKFRDDMGMRDGEVYHAVYTGYHAIVRSAADQVMGFFGQGVRGGHFLVALTNQNRLLIGHSEAGNDPLGFEVGEITITRSHRRGDHRTLIGSTGRREVTDVLHLRSPTAEMHLELPGSAVDAVLRWVDGGGVPPLPPR